MHFGIHRGPRIHSPRISSTPQKRERDKKKAIKKKKKLTIWDGLICQKEAKFRSMTEGQEIKYVYSGD